MIICGIYSIFCKANNKILVGSSNHIMRRYSQHLYNLKRNIHNNPYLQNAWNKYGEINFSLSIIEQCQESDLLKKEDEWIKAKNSMDRNFGYNFKTAERPTHSKETCKKISVAKRGKTPNKVWSQKEREATSARMSLLHKGKHLSEKHISILQSRMADPIIKQNMIDKVTESIRTKYEDTTFRQHIIDTRARGEASHSKFTNDEIRQIRSEWEHVDKSIKGGRWKGISPTWQFCQKWADFKGVSSKAIYGIVMRRTWRFLDVLTDS